MPTYTVKSGDTLSGIGANFGVPYQQITGYRSGNPNVIYPGEVLNIPDKTQPVNQNPVPAPAITPAPGGQSSGASQPQQSYPNAAIASPAPGGQTPPPYAPNVVDQTVDYGGYTWKGQPGGGWVVQSKTGGGIASPSTATTGLFQQPTIDLNAIYENLYNSSDIKTSQDQYNSISKDITDRQTSYNDAVAKVKDNPYLSEATLTGRISKLTDAFNADTANLINEQKTIQDKISMSKADIETRLNIQTKQFDINSQQATQALDQFNSLLSSGALDNATGDDIANITRATGMSSQAIQSAIDATKAKNAKPVPTSVIQFDDGTNTGFAVINTETGQIINKQVVAASAPTATEQKAGQPTAAETKAQETQQNTSSLMTDIKAKKTLRDLVDYYSQVLSIDDIYRLYNSYSPYGQAKETLAEVKQGKFKA